MLYLIVEQKGHVALVILQFLPHVQGAQNLNRKFQMHFFAA